MLIANREDINNSSKWNISLRGFISSAFLDAVHHFNGISLRYQWPHFLPYLQKAGEFFEPLSKDILGKLKTLPILESSKGKMATPPSLIAISDKFMLNGTPLIPIADPGVEYLSSEYPAGDWGYLKLIGVEELTIQSFLKRLNSYITNNAIEFHSQPQPWQSKLADVLLKGISKHLFEIQGLKIIPLRDGRWVSSQDAISNLFFPSKDPQNIIPEGIGAMEISLLTEKSDRRHSLFERLGAKPYKHETICELILQRHSTMYYVASLLPGVLIQHARFLFNSQWRNVRGTFDMAVATSSEAVMKASEVYLNANHTSKEPNFLQAGERKFPLLHQDYIGQYPADHEAWMLWLKRDLNIWQIPRLISSTSDNFNISADMETIMHSWPQEEFLILLRDNWKIYSKWLGKDSGTDQTSLWKVSQKKVRNRIVEHKVECHDCVSRPMNTTVLSSIKLEGDLEGAVSLPILKIPEPETLSWSFLEHLGVQIKDDVKVYIMCLESIRGKDISQKCIANLYEKIQQRYTDDLDLVKKSFKEKSLIFVPTSNTTTTSKWVASNQCVWNGPASLRSIPRLMDLYPNHRQLFSELLEIKSATLETIISETNAAILSQDINHIKDLLLEIDSFLKQTNDPGAGLAVYSLSNSKVFPILQPGIAGLVTLQSSFTSVRWFIADRQHLYDSFVGTLPLLDVAVNEIPMIEHLLNALRLDSRLLSNVAKPKAQKAGKVERDESYENTFRSKVGFIAR